jgi:hypothetical protein
MDLFVVGRSQKHGPTAMTLKIYTKIFKVTPESTASAAAAITRNNEITNHNFRDIS